MTISVGNLIVAGGATVDTSEVLSALNKQGLKVWVGTTSQRDALPENIKNDDKITFLTYDSEEDIYLIVDTIISYSKTWSSVKISTELAKKINSSDVYTKTEVMSLINAKVASALKYKGAVATTAALPSSGQENGDSYYVQADGYMYAWSSDYSDWQALGSATDMTNYYTKSEVDAIAADLAVKFQFTTMPTADSTTVGQIIQYTGADTQDYKNGYWYKGVDNGDSTYDWELAKTGDYYSKSEVAIKYNYTMTGTASLEDDIKTFVTALIALGANTYVGFFDRSGNLGTAGNYSITVYAEAGTSTFASGYITFGAGAMGKEQYLVSYYKPASSSEEWTIKKLVSEEPITLTPLNNSTIHYDKSRISGGIVTICADIIVQSGSSLTKENAVASVPSLGTASIGYILPCLYRNTANGAEEPSFAVIQTSGSIHPYYTKSEYNEIRINASYSCKL